MKVSSFALFAVWLAWVSGAEALPVAETSIPPTAFHQLQKTGFDHFYNLEYDQAISTFQTLRDSAPDNPAVYNNLAAAYFYKQLFAAGVLQGESFAASNRIFRNKIQSDPILDRQFWSANRTAIRLCEQRLKLNKTDENALYACGVAYAARATHQGLIERSRLEALANGRKGSDYHVELARLHSRDYDAYLVPGLLDYVVGSLPASLKFLLFFGGITGDKQRGIEAVEMVAQYGDQAKEDAQIMLAVLYRRAKRYEDAQRVLQKLARVYPRNHIFPLEIASLYRLADQRQEAIAAYEEVLRNIRDGKPGYAIAPAAKLHFELAQLYEKTGDTESAQAHLKQVPGAVGSTEDLEKQIAEMRLRMENKP